MLLSKHTTDFPFGKKWASLAAWVLTLTFTAPAVFAESNTDNPSVEKTSQPSHTDESTPNDTNWRMDASVERRPGSYLGGGAGYSQHSAWFIPQDDEYREDIAMGPIHAWQAFFRVGDAFFEWFAVGFQVNLSYGSTGGETIAGVGILLDATFFPWRGLGLRPSVGLGFSYARAGRNMNSALEAQVLSPSPQPTKSG